VEAALVRIGADDDATYATVVHNVGSSLKSAGRLEESEVWLTRAIDIRARVHGKESAEVIRARSSLANLRLQQKRIDEAAAIEEQLRPMAARLEEPSRKTWLNVGVLRSRIATARGDLKGTESILRGLIGECEKTFAPDSPRLTGLFGTLAATLASERQYGEAISFIDRALRCESQQGSGGDGRVRYLMEKASWHAALGERSSAVDAARAARDIAASQPERNDRLVEAASKLLDRVSK